MTFPRLDRHGFNLVVARDGSAGAERGLPNLHAAATGG